MAGRYTCTLTEEEQGKARRELNEDPKQRAGAVEELRRWVLQDAPHLTCPTDTPFLLKFLRNGKFSQLVARTKLEQYFRKYHETRSFGDVHGIDTRDPKLQAVWRVPFIVPLPKKTPEGVTVLLLQPGKLEKMLKTKTITFAQEHIFKGGLATMEMLLMDESVQVHGLMALQDMTDETVAVVQWMGLERMKTIIQTFERGMPIRIKGSNMYNGGTLFDVIMAMISVFLSAKFKARIRNLGDNLERLYDVIPMACLPDEYLPDEYSGPSGGPLEDIIEHHVTKMASAEVRDHVMRVTSRDYGIDDSKRVLGHSASFRKLNVD